MVDYLKKSKALFTVNASNHITGFRLAPIDAEPLGFEIEDTEGVIANGAFITDELDVPFFKVDAGSIVSIPEPDRNTLRDAAIAVKETSLTEAQLLKKLFAYLFQLENRVRTLEGKPPVTKEDAIRFINRLT